MRLRPGPQRAPLALAEIPGPPDPAALLDDAFDAVVATDLDGAITYWNRAAYRLYGRGRGLDRGGDLRALVPAVVRPQIDGILSVIASGEIVPPFKRPHTYDSGVAAVAEVAATPIRSRAGDVTGAAFFVRYVVEGMEPDGELGRAAADALHAGQVSAGRALVRSEARYRAIVETTEQGVALVDGAGHFVFANERLAKFLGASHDELLGCSARELVGDRARRAVLESGLGSLRYELFHAHPDGGTSCGLVTVSAIEDDDGPATALVLVSDITELKRSQAERERTSVVDPLTDLASATLFRARVERAARLAPTGARAAVLVADVDRFRDVNDAFGFALADDLLRVVARRIADVCPADATVARVVGDQFAVFVEEPGEQADLVALADRIHESVSVPAFFDDVELVPSVSVGVALAVGGAARAPGSPAGSQAVVDDVLRRAHGAMRSARQAGPGRTEFDDVRALDSVVARLAMIPELRRAIREDQLEVLYQPVVCLASGRMQSVEALVRWNHPQRGLLEPSEFIPAAEDSGLVGALGRWVFERACVTAAAWHATGARLPVAINVSGHQLADPHFVDEVGTIVDRTGVDPRLLVVEVTESVFVDDRAALVERLAALRALGCRIAIDDFGTGYSSLAQLGRLPLDILKIDRMFVQDVAENSRALALVRSVIDVAHAFGLEVIAEGVETEAQRAALIGLGCRAAQGYHWSRPMPADALTARLADVTPSDP